MNITGQIQPPRAPRMITSQAEAPEKAHRSEADVSTFGEFVAETLPLIDLVPEVGPPLVFLVVPYLLCMILLIGPFALLLTIVILVVAATALVGLAGMVIAAPYLLVRRLRVRRATHAASRVLAHPIRAGRAGHV
jgi:hypothetical protein